MGAGKGDKASSENGTGVCLKVEMWGKAFQAEGTEYAKAWHSLVVGGPKVVC